MSQHLNDKLLFQAVKSGSESAFEILFNLYYGSLCNQVLLITKDKMAAEEIVSDFFFKVWTKKDAIHIHTTVEGYFYLGARNAALNYLKTRKDSLDIDALPIKEKIEEKTPLDMIISQETMGEWEQKISKLPTQRQIVFRMNKLEGKKYKEIAEELSLSEKTVRNHVQLALRTLTTLSVWLIVRF